MRVSATITLLLFVACVPEEGPLMAPGQDCVGCHDGGAARRWTAAGTWARGAHVSVTDVNGKTVTMRGNKVGNFYTAEPLTPPLTVNVDGAEMPADALTTPRWTSTGMRYAGCNLCHGGPREIVDWELRAPLMAPGRDCLACHDGVMALELTVAGTWKPGAVVRVVDRNSKSWTLPPANEAGNFYTEEPLEFPLREVWVDGSSMDLQDQPVTRGGCNACHGRGGEAGED